MKSFKKFIVEEAFPVNQGHAYEFVLAAAMVARFTDRFDDGTPQPLTPASVEDVMKQYFGLNRMWEVEEGDDEIDVIEFDGGGLPPEVMSALNDAKLRSGPVVQKMIKDAIAAVNKNRSLTALSNDVITNGKRDEVEIRCGGTTGQMATKSDVDVYVNDRVQRKVGFSVKYAGTKQAGQFAGTDASKNLIDAFASFGMDIKSFSGLRKVRDAAGGLSAPYASRNDPKIDGDKTLMFGAVQSLFTDIIRKFDKRYVANAANAKKILGGLLKANKGKEEDIELIRTAVSFDKKTFDKISELVVDAAKNGNVEWRPMSGTNPKIGFFANGTELFSLRFRYDSDPINRQKTAYRPRFRFYVENGRYLDDLAATV